MYRISPILKRMRQDVCLTIAIQPLVWRSVEPPPRRHISVNTRWLIRVSRATNAAVNKHVAFIFINLLFSYWATYKRTLARVLIAIQVG